MSELRLGHSNAIPGTPQHNLFPLPGVEGQWNLGEEPLCYNIPEFAGYEPKGKEPQIGQIRHATTNGTYARRTSDSTLCDQFTADFSTRYALIALASYSRASVHGN